MDELRAKIKVIAIGGAGGNAVNTMIKENLQGIDYVAINTDYQSLHLNLAPIKLQIGQEITKGLGAGSNPEVGKQAALENYEKIAELIGDSNMVFITAGMGGGTGTGAAPIIAKLAKEMGALTIGVVTKPFKFEGKKKYNQALQGIEYLKEHVDSLITIPNDKLLDFAGSNLTLVDTFKKADDILVHAVKGISDLINQTGLINTDFADICTVMSKRGLALMGTGVATGEKKSLKAAQQAVESPLLENLKIDGATGLIINISGSDQLTTSEVYEAVQFITEAADDDAEIIFGAVIDNTLEDQVKITVIATGIDQSMQPQEKNNILKESIPKEQNYAEDQFDTPSYLRNSRPDFHFKSKRDFI